MIDGKNIFADWGGSFTNKFENLFRKENRFFLKKLFSCWHDNFVGSKLFYWWGGDAGAPILRWRPGAVAWDTICRIRLWADWKQIQFIIMFCNKKIIINLKTQFANELILILKGRNWDQWKKIVLIDWTKPQLQYKNIYFLILYTQEVE